MLEKITKLIDVKSIVTIVMTIALVLMVTGVFEPSKEVFTLFASSYGSIITYFFTKKKNEE